MTCNHNDLKNWKDEPGRRGWIRTTCGQCGRFIGNRPKYLGSSEQSSQPERKAIK
jgi:hypothetical protein